MMLCTLMCDMAYKCITLTPVLTFFRFHLIDFLQPQFPGLTVTRLMGLALALPGTHGETGKD